jgi:hypothetical protein
LCIATESKLVFGGRIEAVKTSFLIFGGPA